MLRLGVVRRLAWGLADVGIMRERIEESFKRRMVVRATDVEEAEEVGFVEVAELEAQSLPEARSASR
jgi:hypothetical protein